MEQVAVKINTTPGKKQVLIKYNEEVRLNKIVKKSNLDSDTINFLLSGIITANAVCYKKLTKANDIEEIINIIKG